MILQMAIVVAVAIVALGVGWWAQGRQPDAPISVGHRLPEQSDRADFARPDAPWLVAVFTSATCESCAKVLTAAMPLESGEVAVQEVEVKAEAALHERYEITAVPSVVVADADGVTRASFLGPPSTADLWAAVADVRS